MTHHPLRVIFPGSQPRYQKAVPAGTMDSERFECRNYGGFFDNLMCAVGSAKGSVLRQTDGRSVFGRTNGRLDK